MNEPHTATPDRAEPHSPVEAGTTEHRDGGRLFWTMTAVGWSVMAGAVIGAFGDCRDAQPTVLARWLVGSAILHDLAWLPVVAIAGAVLARASRDRLPSAIRWALATSAVFAVIAWPFVRGYGRSRGNPSLLPRNYAHGLIAYLVVIWLLAGIVLAVGRRRTRRAEEVEQSPST